MKVSLSAPDFSGASFHVFLVPSDSFQTTSNWSLSYFFFTTHKVFTMLNLVVFLSFPISHYSCVNFSIEIHLHPTLFISEFLMSKEQRKSCGNMPNCGAFLSFYCNCSSTSIPEFPKFLKPKCFQMLKSLCRFFPSLGLPHFHWDLFPKQSEKRKHLLPTPLPPHWKVSGLIPFYLSVQKSSIVKREF